MHGKLLNVVRATEFGFNELHKGDRVCVRAFSGGGSTEILPFTEDLQAVNEAILIQVLKLQFAGDPELEPAAERRRSDFAANQRRTGSARFDRHGQARRARTRTKSVVRDLWNSDAVLSELILDRPGKRTFEDRRKRDRRQNRRRHNCGR